MNFPNEPDEIPKDLQRYSRQIKFGAVGLSGQQKLAQSCALVVGCGALGSVIAESLVRAGVGRLRIVDRDFLEIHNLQRQVLYDEFDVAAGLPKVIAAKTKLERINSSVQIDAFVEDLNYKNISQLAAGANVIVDGTDNFETRFLVNDFAVESNTPWIYGGCLGSEGQSMTIVPGESNCLHCLMSHGPPPPGTTPGCDLAGILGPVVNVVASIEALEAIKILTGNQAAVNQGLTVIDLWSGRLSSMKLGDLAERVNCSTCRQGERNWLNGDRTTQSAVLCGRNAVQLRASSEADLDLAKLEQKLHSHGNVVRNEFLLKFHIGDYILTVFENGRTIVTGTADIAKARSLFAQWIGN